MSDGFVPWRADRPTFVAWTAEPVAPQPDPPPPLDKAAFQAGFAAGAASVTEDLAVERAALARLAESLAALKPEPAGPLALLLVETVDRLVRQLVGEVAIDPTVLLSRAHAAAALVAEEARPSAVRLNPGDLARLDAAALPVAMVGDAGVAPGAVLLETGEGWIEDSLAQRLDAFRASLTQALAA